MGFMLRAAGAVLGLAVMGLVALLVGARFADGPIGIVAGGPFRSGELVSGREPDWSFVVLRQRRPRGRVPAPRSASLEDDLDPGARRQGLHPLRLVT